MTNTVNFLFLIDAKHILHAIKKTTIYAPQMRITRNKGQVKIIMKNLKSNYHVRKLNLANI